ncbi:MAG: lycopene cyclase domain-containing protein, partial [Fluviicola sp.]
MSFYAWIILGTIAGPFLLSFDKKVAFYKLWKHLFLAELIVGIPFLIWDEYFTVLEVWGFNSKYLTGIFVGHLPLEEVCFFIVAPYGCVFIHQCIKAYFPNLKLENYGKVFAFTFILSGLVLAMMNLTKWYTMTACSLSSILLIGIAFQLKAKWFGLFALSFTVSMIPFLVVNGLLTGFATPEPVVWYNESHN